MLCLVASTYPVPHCQYIPCTSLPVHTLYLIASTLHPYPYIFANALNTVTLIFSCLMLIYLAVSIVLVKGEPLHQTQSHIVLVSVCDTCGDSWLAHLLLSPLCTCVCFRCVWRCHTSQSAVQQERFCPHPVQRATSITDR